MVNSPSRENVPPAAPLLILVSCALSNGSADAAPTVSKITPDDHFPLIPNIPVSGASKAKGPRGDSAFSEVVDNFVLIMDNATEIEDQLLRNDVIGEPLTYLDNNLGMYVRVRVVAMY